MSSDFWTKKPGAIASYKSLFKFLSDYSKRDV